MTSALFSLLQDSQSLHGFSGQVLALLFEIGFKGTVFLGFAAACTLAVRRSSAAARHLVWILTLGLMLALPAASLLLPAWKLAIIPPPSPRQAIEEDERVVLARSRPVGLDRPDRTVEPVAAAPAGTPSYPTWPDWLLALYLAGLLLVAARTVVGAVRVRALARRSCLLETSPARSILELASRRLGLARAVELRTSAGIAIPFTCGILHPTVFLPDEARCWPRRQLEFVLVHELAHVKRHDCLTQMLAQAACAFYWFHPLVWFAALRMRKEREKACDDAVLSLDHPPADYADFLVALSRDLRRLEPIGRSGVAMAHPSQLEARMKALLDPELNHRALALRYILFAAAVAVAVLMPAAAIHATAKSAMGSISGTVCDPSGAVIPGAEVTVLNLETHQRITLDTGDDGSWNLPGIPGGRYRIEIVKPGFAITSIADLELKPSGHLHQIVTMDVGPVWQQVVVSGHKLAGKPSVSRTLGVPKRVRVGGTVEAAKLIYQPAVVYPTSAEKRGIQGTVILRAVIGTSGQILSLSPVSGPDPALISAAINAVRRWRYKPTLLNGAPVEVATTIEVVFQLDKTVEAIQFHGNHRVPASALYARLPTRVGDVYTVDRVDRDLSALWKTGYFDDIRVVANDGKTGDIVTFYVRERRLIRSIDYKGLSSVSQGDLQTRFLKDKVGLEIMSQYDPVVVKRAATLIEEMLTEKGRPGSTVRWRTQDVPLDAVAITFLVVEGRKVKTGDTAFKNVPTTHEPAHEPDQPLTAPDAKKESALLPAAELCHMAQTCTGIKLAPLSRILIPILLIEGNSSEVFNALGSIAGLNVRFDRTFRPRHISLHLSNVSIGQALEAAAGLAGDFIKPTGPNSILVTPETQSTGP
jgi:TonB family protein